MQISAPPPPRPHESKSLGARLGSEFYTCCPCDLLQAEVGEALSPCSKTWKRNDTRGEALAKSGGAGHLAPITGPVWDLGVSLRIICIFLLVLRCCIEPAVFILSVPRSSIAFHIASEAEAGTKRRFTATSQGRIKVYLTPPFLCSYFNFFLPAT